MKNDLLAQRKVLEQNWSKYVFAQQKPNINEPLIDSWERSSQHLNPLRPNIPVYDPEETEKEWRDSLLYKAASPLLEEIKRTADDSNYIVAICDGKGKLLWTHSSRFMQRRAEQLHFVPGGILSEQGAGTNALDLALRNIQPSRVFSAEHYMQAFHDWVCYSSPIRDPQSGLPLGVLDFSSSWQNANTLGLMTATALARYIEARLLHYRIEQQEQGFRQKPQRLELNFCGEPELRFEGEKVKLSPRQYEIMALLALHPEGLSLESLHAHLYGDKAISLSTLKAEVSTLRQVLKGEIGSRPYSLNVGYQADFLEIQSLLQDGDIRAACYLYKGSLLKFSESPSLKEWRVYLDNALQAALLKTGSPELLWHYSKYQPDDFEVLLKLVGALPANDPRLAMLRARLELLDFKA